MKKFLIPCVFLMALVWESPDFNSIWVTTAHHQNLESKHDTLPSKILILTAFDVNNQKMRKNKKELFAELLTELKRMIQVKLKTSTGAKTEIIEGVAFPDTDSILMLLDEKNASNAIVIKNYNAFFNQGEVEVTKSPEGKSRVARYDICSEITYLYYNNTRLIDSTSVQVCKFYSNRSVASGLLAAGPNIVSNKKEALDITRENVERYFYISHRE